MKLNKLVSTLNMEHSTWLKYRRKGVGGSDAGSICGLNPYSTANSKGTMLLLRVQLIEYHAKYTALGTIPSYAYQNYCEMYAAYHELGGNGMVTKMKQEIEELHIKRKGE